MELTALAGNAQIKAQLAHREGDLAHAYIVAGPAGSGRHTLAAQMEIGRASCRERVYLCV